MAVIQYWSTWKQFCVLERSGFYSLVVAFLRAVAFSGILTRGDERDTDDKGRDGEQEELHAVQNLVSSCS